MQELHPVISARATIGAFEAGRKMAIEGVGCTMAPVKVVRPRISFADLERAPEDGRRYELYDGEVFVVPAPLPRHQVVQLLIAEMLHHRG